MMLPDVRLIAAVIVVALSALAGWQVRGWKEDAARLAAEREAQANYQNIAAAYGKALDDANATTAKDRQQAALDRADFQRRLRNATRPGRPPLMVCGNGIADRRLDDPGVRVRLDPAFVRLWDDALDIGLPAALRPPGDQRPGAGADLLDPEDAIENLAANGEQCNELRSRLLAAQRWVRGVEVTR